MGTPIVCAPRRLPGNLVIGAAQRAVQINPFNHPRVEAIAALVGQPTPMHIALATDRKWHTKGVRLTVSFLDDAAADLRARIILHMNAWSVTSNVCFTETAKDGQVRVARVGGDEGGYWSYIGTDILSIDADKPTMNLEGFTMDTEDSEFHRVVRHETGHTLGFVHEHMRAELVAKIDVDKAITFFGATQGWNADEVRAQVLTPIEEGSLLGTSPPDPNSVMCYQIPGSLTKDGQPILGGTDIDESDYEFAGKMYPLLVLPTPDAAGG
jgi:hypothetical protein